MLISPRQLSELKPPPGVRVVSFDIFDTLILRCVDPPPAVTELVAECLAAHGVLACSPEKYLRLRHDVERQLREGAVAKGYDPECSLEEVVVAMATFLGLPSEAAQAMLAIELEVESRLLITAPGMCPLLERLSGNYRLVTVSDTHLTQQQLAGLLRQAGLEHFFAAIYASCDHRRSKQQGGLFDVVLAVEGVRPGELLHLGDNFHSDFLSPRNKRIRALCLFDPINLSRRAMLRSEGNSGYHFYFGGGALEADADWRGGQLRSFGYHLFGPLLTLFNCLLREELADFGSETVFFLARDGHLLKRLFDRGRDGRWPGMTGYLAVSRYTAALASVRRLGTREVILMGFACRTLRDALKRLAVADDPVLPSLLAGTKMSLDTALSQDEIYRALEVLFALPVFQSLVLTTAGEMRSCLRDYLAERGFFGKGRRVALVDIGWHGTIQECLETAFCNDPWYPEVQGFYFGLVKPVVPSDVRRRGLVFDYRCADADANALFLYQEAWELVCRGFHGSTVGYRVKAGHVVPLWKERCGQGTERDLGRQVLALQHGVLNCADDFARRAALRPVNQTALIEIARARFDAAISFPDPVAAGLLDDCCHSDDFGNERLQHFAPRFGCRELATPRAFLTDFLAVPWREGALVKSGFPCLTLYYVMKRALCWKRSGTMGRVRYLPDTKTFLPALTVDTLCGFLGVVAREPGRRVSGSESEHDGFLRFLEARIFIAATSLVLRLLALLPVRLAEAVFGFIMNAKKGTT